MMLEGLVRRGTLLTIAVLIVCVLGIAAALRIPVQMIPDLEVRTISVRTSWPGATPQDVEKEILVEQEEFLRAVPNMERMTATASTGEAQIELDFPFGTDINDALIRVSNALSQVPAYPANVDEPRLFASSFSQNSFMYFRVGPLPGNPRGLDMDMMRDFVEDHVRTRMERVPGVSEVRVYGGAERQVQVLVDPARLAERNLTLDDVRRAITGRNRDVSGGDVTSGKRRYLLRTVGRFRGVDALEDLVLARRGAALIRLGDVATVRLDHYEIRSLGFAEGQPVLRAAVRREAGSNVIAIKEAMLPEIEAINREVLEPAGMHIALTADDVVYVVDSIRNVWQNLALGAAFASLVMFLFLRSVRTTLVGVVGIPICTIAAFIGLALAGRTVNVISLAGVAFAIGMTLDNSIVVLESIELERRRGMARLHAAVAGVRKVWPAVLASTLTTVLVFAPLLFVQEEAGQLYSDVAIAISASILVSMLVAITVVPTASGRLPARRRAAGAEPGRTARGVVGAVGWLIASWPRRVAVMALVAVASAAVIVKLTPPAEYLPEGEEAKIFASMIPPPGYSLEEMAAVTERVQAYLLPFLEHEPERFARGEAEVPALSYLNVLVQPERMRVIAEPKDPAHADALMAAFTRTFREYAGMRAFATRGSIISSNDGGTRSINLDVAGPSLEQIYGVALAAYRRAGEVFDEPQIDSDPRTLSLSQPLLEIRPRWERAAELGLSAGELGFTVAALTDGAYVDEFFLDDDKIDVYLYSAGGGVSDLAGIGHLPVYTPQGTVVPLGAIADVVETVDTDTIRRVNGRRTVTLRVIPPRSVALETGVEMVRSEVVEHLHAAGEIPAAVSIDITGASDQLEATREALTGNYAVALLLCYLLLVAVFSHWGFPLLIMTTIPLGVAGGLVGLWLMNAVGAMLPALGLAAIRQPFDMITMMGFLILMGTVVNNPILIVAEAVRNVRDDALGAVAAVRAAVAARLRPIAMSSITTFCGLAPLVFIPGAGTELYRGLGAIVLFGLMGAAVVTLTFLPALLASVLALGERRAEGALAAGSRPEPAPGD